MSISVLKMLAKFLAILLMCLVGFPDVGVHEEMKKIEGALLDDQMNKEDERIVKLLAVLVQERDQYNILQKKFAECRMKFRTRALRLALKDNYFLRNTLGLDKQEYISIIAQLETDLARCRDAHISQKSLFAENQLLKKLNEELVSAVDNGVKREKGVLELLQIAEQDNDILRNKLLLEKRGFVDRIKALEELVSATFAPTSFAWEAVKIWSYADERNFENASDLSSCPMLEANPNISSSEEDWYEEDLGSLPMATQVC